jgi:hypothetical protein
MSATLFEPAVRDAGAARVADNRDRRGLTLEELLSGAWEGLAAHASVACPACGEAAAMRPRYSAGGSGAVIGGRCGGCGSTLA